MILPKPTEGGNFEITPSGTFIGVCYRFLDLGTQSVEYMGDHKIQRKVMLSWELADELMKDGRPFSASKTYTWSMHEKSTLRKDLEAWRGKAFVDEDFEGENAFNTKKLLGAPCMLTVTHETKGDKTFSKVASIGKLLRGATPPPLVNKLQYLALIENEYDAEVYGSLSDNLKAKIAASPEYQEIALGHRQHDDPGNGFHAGHDPDSDIPF
jgi:hypothetical protein